MPQTENAHHELLESIFNVAKAAKLFSTNREALPLKNFFTFRFASGTQFVLSSRGTLHFIHRGYRYTLNQKSRNGDKMHWECVQARRKTVRCMGRLTTSGKSITKISGVHTCLQDYNG